MSIIDTIVFLIFTGGVVLLGCSFFSKKRTSDEFTSAGRSLPGWVVGMSIFATYVSRDIQLKANLLFANIIEIS